MIMYVYLLFYSSVYFIVLYVCVQYYVCIIISMLSITDRFIIFYPFHVCFINCMIGESHPETMNEDLVDKLKALADRISQDEIRYPDIICVVESSSVYHGYYGHIGALKCTKYDLVFKKRLSSVCGVVRTNESMMSSVYQCMTQTRDDDTMVLY